MSLQFYSILINLSLSLNSCMQLVVTILDSGNADCPVKKPKCLEE